MSKKFIKDDAEMKADNMQQLLDFLAERESNAQWITDDDELKANTIRFRAINDEPILVSTRVAELKSSKFPRFEASEDAYVDTMFSPEYGYTGTTQMVFVKGKLYPIGQSAVKGLLARAGLGADGYERLKGYSPESLSAVLNLLMEAISEKNSACVLVQDEKVRAINSGRYAICPTSYVAQATQDWMLYDYPLARFVSGYVCHDYATWTVDLEAYTNDILGGFPDLISSGFTPALVVITSNTAQSSVSLKPALMLNGNVFQLAYTIDCPHVAGGNCAERTQNMEKEVLENFDAVFSVLFKSAEQIAAMGTMTISNAYNALLRCMHKLKLPKQQGMEAAEQFKFLYPASASAYDCLMAVVDACSYIIRDNPNNQRKQFEAAGIVGRAAMMDWKKFDIAGDFSW